MLARPESGILLAKSETVSWLGVVALGFPPESVRSPSGSNTQKSFLREVTDFSLLALSKQVVFIGCWLAISFNTLSFFFLFFRSTGSGTDGLVDKSL